MSDEKNIRVQAYGGGHRISIAPGGNPAETEVPQDEQPQESARAYRGGARYSPGTGQLQPTAPQRVSVNGADFNEGAGVLATARRPLIGGPVAELTPETIVTLPGGMEVQLRHAVTAG